AGEHPVLIDCETMLSPQSRDHAVGAEATRLARDRLNRSVFSTYLLPRWTRSMHDGAVFDGSAFGVDAEEERARALPRWVFVNTDRMNVARATREKSPPPRAARVDGRPLRVYEYEAELQSGFETMYRFLVRERNALLAPESPFERLAGTQVRFIYRNTT